MKTVNFLDLFCQNEGEECLADYEYPDDLYFKEFGISLTDDEQYPDLCVLFDNARNRGVKPQELASMLNDNGTFLLNPKRMKIVMSIVKQVKGFLGEASVFLENNNTTISTSVIVDADAFKLSHNQLRILSNAFQMADSVSIDQKIDSGVRISMTVYDTLKKVRGDDDAV